MVHYLWIKQRGEGCDYTIGCGQLLVKLPDAYGPADLEQRKAILMEEFEEQGLTGDREAEQVMVLEWQGNAMPVYNNFLAAQQEERQEQERQKKLKELARLKAELGVK